MSFVQELQVLMQAAAAALKEASNPEASLSPAAEDIVNELQRLSAEQKGELPGHRLQNGLVSRSTSVEAVHLLDVVKRACGPASKDVLQLLNPLLGTLMNGSIQVSSSRACTCRLLQLSQSSQYIRHDCLPKSASPVANSSLYWLQAMQSAGQQGS